jgi:NADH-quinone oxidoreductase subunit C
LADAPVAETESEGAPDAAAPEEVSTLREQAVDALARLQSELGDAIIEHGAAFSDVVIRVQRDAWRRSIQVCKEKLGCDYLSFISGIDWMPTPAVTEEGSGDTSTPAQPKEQTYGVAGSAGRYQVFALVESTRRISWRVILKTDLPDDDLHVDSVVAIYPGADWHEREAWEMYGFVFDGHPSLRHLYLPSEFEGHPLRKDYPLLAREVKPWPGLVDVEPMPGEPEGDEPAAVEGAS